MLNSLDASEKSSVMLQLACLKPEKYGESQEYFHRPHALG